MFDFTGNNVTWTLGGGGIYTISNNQMSEFVFFVDTTGKWLVTQISGGAVLD